MELKNMENTSVQTEKTIDIKAPKGNRKRKIKPTKLDAVKQQISFGGKWKATSFLEIIIIRIIIIILIII